MRFPAIGKEVGEVFVGGLVEAIEEVCEVLDGIHADARCARAPNMVWAGDVTYVATGEGWTSP